jgi:polyhydroxyalkanoate synthesis regulator phasin
MDSIFRKLLYTSVGFISLSADRLIRLIDDLVYEQKISSEEGKRIVESFSKESQSKKEDFDGQITDWVQDFMGKFTFAENSDIEEVKNRLQKLEAEEKETLKKTPVKTTRKSTKDKK